MNCWWENSSEERRNGVKCRWCLGTGGGASWLEHREGECDKAQRNGAGERNLEETLDHCKDVLISCALRPSFRKLLLLIEFLSASFDTLIYLVL